MIEAHQGEVELKNDFKAVHDWLKHTVRLR